MTICMLGRITQTYGAHTLFSYLSCEVKQGERIGLIGRNGEGKTTLLKLMAGKIAPSEGRIIWKKDLSIGILEQIPNIEDGKKIYDLLLNVFGPLLEIKKQMNKMEYKLSEELGPSLLEDTLEKYGRLQDQFINNGGYELDVKINRIVHGLQISHLLEKEWRQLSGGERTKVGLAQLLLQEPDLLLLDEPTNHLDLSAIEWLTDFVKKYHGTVVIVSHDRYFLDDVVKGIYELDQGELHIYHCNYTRYVKEREERLLREFQQYQDQQKKVNKMKETIKRLKDWANRSNPPNAGLHRRAKSMEKALARIELLQRPILEHKKINLDLCMERRSGKDVVLFENVGKQFENHVLFQQVNMHVRFKERIAIVGANGSGKTTLLNMILGTVRPDQGEINRGSNLSIGFLSQHGNEMNPERTVLEEFREEVHVTEGEARKILSGFLFYGASVFRKVHDLSGGERMRLRWAQLVHQNHNVLIMDEPTNHLDIESKEILEDALNQFQGTIIAVSHDRYFLDHFFNITYWISDQQLTRYEGNYTFARERRSAQR